MTTKTVTINLENGLEARPIAMLVQVASQHDSTVYLESDGKKVNAKTVDLTGIIQAFNAIPAKKGRIHIITTSPFIPEALKKRTMYKQHLKLWQQLCLDLNNFQITCQVLRGHSGDKLQEKCTRLALKEFKGGIQDA